MHRAAGLKIMPLDIAYLTGVICKLTDGTNTHVLWWVVFHRSGTVKLWSVSALSMAPNEDEPASADIWSLAGFLLSCDLSDSVLRSSYDLPAPRPALLRNTHVCLNTDAV